MHDTASTPRTDTRSRVQKVALELFAEQGYEKTSLREIAERLGVTKAALYYHFKSKEDIVASLFAELKDEIDAIVDWAAAEPPGPETRQAIVRRYTETMRGPGGDLMVFMSQNARTLCDLRAVEEARGR